MMDEETAVSRGKEAESQACQYLVSQGLVFEDKNYRCPTGEIDLIMKDKTYLVFVEVRLRRDGDYGHGIETVTKAKRGRIIRSALHYLQHKKLLDKIYCRFDVIGLSSLGLLPPNEKFLWIKNAFEVEY